MAGSGLHHDHGIRACRPPPQCTQSMGTCVALPSCDHARECRFPTQGKDHAFLLESLTTPTSRDPLFEKKPLSSRDPLLLVPKGPSCDVMGGIWGAGMPMSGRSGPELMPAVVIGTHTSPPSASTAMLQRHSWWVKGDEGKVRSSRSMESRVLALLCASFEKAAHADQMPCSCQ